MSNLNIIILFTCFAIILLFFLFRQLYLKFIKKEEIGMPFWPFGYVNDSWRRAENLPISQNKIITLIIIAILLICAMLIFFIWLLYL